MAGRVEMLAFLFTDIEGSTNLLRDLGVRYRTVLLDHRSLLRTAFERFGGRMLGSEGDSLFAAFPNPKDALLAAAEGQLVQAPVLGAVNELPIRAPLSSRCIAPPVLRDATRTPKL